MGLEEVKQGLQDELEQKRQALLDEAEERKEQLLADADEKLQAYREEAERETEEKVDQLQRKKRSKAKLEARKDILAVKKDAVDDVVQTAGERLQRHDDELLPVLLQHARDTIDIGRVVCAPRNEDDIDYDTDTADILGGVICYDTDGEQSLDLSYDTLLQQVREDNVNAIAEELFT